MVKVNKTTPNTPPKLGPRSLRDRITDIGFDSSDGINICLYGRSGTGKTTLWSTFPGPILALICSGGTDKPGELRSIDTDENRKKVKTATLEASEEIHEAIEMVDAGSFKTIVLDHVTGFQDLVLRELLGMTSMPEQKAFGMATKEHYGQCSGICKDLLRKLLNAKCNVVIVAQERESGREGGSDDLLVPNVGAALTPSLAGWLNTAVDYIAQTFIRPKMITMKGDDGEDIQVPASREKKDYCLRVGPHEVYTTKFRVPLHIAKKIPEAIINPSYADIMATIRGGVKK